MRQMDNGKTFHSGERALGRFIMAGILLPLLIGFFLQGAVWAQGHVSAKTWPQEASDLAPDPAVVFHRLPNGVRYLLLKNSEPKGRVSMHLLVQAGSYHEAEDQQGVAHFLEHMMFNGSAQFPPGEMVKYFQMIGMQFGPDANAHTGFKETVYDVLLPSGEDKSMADGLRVLLDYAGGALLLPEEIEKEKGVVLAEKRSRDSADYRTFESVLRFEYPHARFAHRLPIGEESVIRGANRMLLKRFYDTWYRPDRMVVVAVGDFDTDSAARLIEKEFGSMKPRAAESPEPDFGTVSHSGTTAFYHHEPESGAASVSIESVHQVEPRSDSKVFRREELARDMASRMIQNRLEEMISNSSAPFTSASLHGGRFLERIRYTELSADCSPEHVEKTLMRLEQTLRAALKYGFSKTEWMRVKREYISLLDKAVAQAPTRESGALAEEIMDDLNDREVFLSPAQEREIYLPFLNAMTLEEVQGALKEAWGKDQRLILVTGNAKLSAQKPEAWILSVFHRSEKVPVEKPVEAEVQAFPYLPVPSKGEISRRVDAQDLGISQIDFENGVRLNLKKTDFEADKIRVTIAFGEGKSAEPLEKPGLSLLTEAVMNESGLGKLNKNDLEYALAGTQVKAQVNVQEDKFILSGTCTSKEMELLFQILHAHLVDPGFSQEAYRLSMDRFSQRYDALARDIDGGMPLHGKKFLAGEDSRFGMPPLDAFNALTLSDVQTWMTQVLGESTLEVNVVGDMDPEEVAAKAAVYFGSLPKRTPQRSEAAKSPTFPSGKSLSLKVDTKIPKGLLVVAYPSADFWDISRTRRLSVLADIFSEKLREKIREELGASYSPFAYNEPSRAYPGYGVFQAHIYITPDQADLVTKAVKEISPAIIAAGISQEELDRSLKPILTGIKDLSRTNEYWLGRVLTGSVRHPQQLEWSRTMASDYAATTCEEIQRLAAAFLDNEKAAVITILPEK